MQEPVHIVGAQKRATKQRRTVAGTVGAVAVMAAVGAAVSAPAVVTVAAVVVVAALAVKRRGFGRGSPTDSRDGPRRERPEPAAAD